jgi:hypothetical protein
VDVLLVLERRDTATGEWLEDSVQRFDDGALWRGHVRARRLGERWEAAAPADHRCAVCPTTNAA